MIEFKGELTERCKKVFLKRHYKILFILCILACIIITTPLVIIGYYAENYGYVFYTFAIIGIFCIMLNMIPKLNPQEKGFLKELPHHITIENDIISKESLVRYVERDIQNVKSVIDEGDWYLITFYFPYKLAECICQKDLLVQGSIEEFEEIFQGLIVRKTIR